MSANENCPRCGQPADCVMFYGFMDVFKLEDLRMSFGCTKCNLQSGKVPISAKWLQSMLEKLKQGLEKQELQK